MKGLAVTYSGLEEAAAQEIKELIGSEPVLNGPVLIFDIKDETDLIFLSYRSQSLGRIMLYLDTVSAAELEDNISKVDFSKVKGTFAVRCKHPYDDDTISSEVEQIVGKVIDAKVDLNKPVTTIIAFVDEGKCHLGIDMSGDISKRDYRLFLSPNNLKSIVAFALLRFSDFKVGDVLLDPFCGTGTIPTEAALYLTKRSHSFFSKDKFPFHKYFDKDFEDMLDKWDKDVVEVKKPTITGTDHLLRSVKSSQKNAKIAGVHKAINFSKLAVDWIDTKFEKGTVDRIITNPPQISKHSREKEVEKIYKELFYQADFILKKDGLLTTINYHPELIRQCAAHYKFGLKEEKVIHQGRQR